MRQARRMMTTWSRPCALLVTALAAAAGALVEPPLSAREGAQPEQRAEGMVVEVQDLGGNRYELVVDLGARDGLAQGDSLLLLSRVEVVHPVSKHKIEDYIPLGEQKVARVGSELAVLDVQTDRPGRVKVGDKVRRPQAEPAPEAAAAQPASAPAGACEACAGDPAAMEVHQAWLRTVGKPIPEREVEWQLFLALHPDSPFAREVNEELRALAALAQSASTEALPPPAPEPLRCPEPAAMPAPAGPDLVVRHAALGAVTEGTRVCPVVALQADEPLADVRLYYRPEGDLYYQDVAMSQDGEGYYRGEVPSAMVRAPGIEYFIEAQGAEGSRLPVVASGERPQRVGVEPALVADRPVSGRSLAHVSFEWVDFYLDDPGRDYFWKADGDLLYRLDAGMLSSFRMGVGVFEGEGGPAAEVEAEEFVPTRLSLGYVYFEPALSFADGRLSLLPRLVFGSIREKVRPDDPYHHSGEGMFGFHTYLRIGRDTETNLLLGGSLTSEMGNEALIAMNLELLEDVPMGVSAVATSFPVGSDYAARLMYLVGWRPNDRVALEAQFGVNMRNIRHIGIGGGFGVAVSW